MRVSRWLLSLLLAAPAVAQAPQEPHPYRPGIDIVDYAITMSLPDTGARIAGDATLTLRRTAAVDSLVLDLRDLRVSAVRVNGQSRRFRRTDSTLVVPLPPGDSGTFKVRVEYAGRVTDGLIARRDSLRRWTYFGDNWPNRARFWIPSVDHPSDKATVSWTVRAPRGRTVIANGRLLGTQTVGRGRAAREVWRWRESKPIATYLMVIAAAPLAKVDLGETACGLAETQKCVHQAVFAFPERRTVLPGSFSRAGDIVKFFASTIAPFPYEKLYHLQSATRFGGMENATAIFYANNLFRRPGGAGEGIIAHETAHQWFGNSVTERDWPHLWLSEGFATYFSSLWTQRAHGDSAFRAELATSRDRILADTNAVTRQPVIDTTETDLLALLDLNSYDKGAWVLHMLRSEIGDSAFFGGLRMYYAAHKHGTAVTEDLETALETFSGRNLKTFFDQWLRRPGYPELDVSWAADSASRSIAITIAQADRFGPFEFPLRMALVDANGVARRVEFSVPAVGESKLQLPISGSVASVVVDPDVQLLARITVRHVTSP